MLDVGHGCCRSGSRRGKRCIPSGTDPLLHPSLHCLVGGGMCGSPHLGEGSFEDPRVKLCVLTWQPPFCCAGAKSKWVCEGGAHATNRGCPQPPLASRSRPMGINGRLYAPVSAGSGAVETARGQNSLANKTVLFTVGEQEFRGVVWQEARTLAYWKIICPSAHLMFFPSPLPVSLRFSGGDQFLLPQAPQDRFAPSFPPPSTALCSGAGRGRQEELGVPLPTPFTRGAAALTAVRAVG